MKEKTLKGFWITASVIIIAIATVGFNTLVDFSLYGILSSVTLILILAIFSFTLWKSRIKLKERKAGYPKKDERVLLIEGRAGHYTYLITLYFMLALMWIFAISDWMYEIPQPGALPIIILIMLFSAGVYAFLRWHLNRK